MEGKEDVWRHPEYGDTSLGSLVEEAHRRQRNRILQANSDRGGGRSK